MEVHNPSQLSMSLAFLVPISLSVAFLVASSSLSPGQAKAFPKGYMYELQYWEWQVKKRPTMKDINLEDIPRNAKLTSVKILRQVDSMNYGVVQNEGVELSYFVLPEKKGGKVNNVQVYLSVSKHNGTAGTQSKNIYLPTMKLGMRHFLGGSYGEREMKANAFCLVITESEKSIIQIWDGLDKLRSTEGP
jgi:hypothetical protein